MLSMCDNNIKENVRRKVSSSDRVSVAWRWSYDLVFQRRFSLTCQMSVTSGFPLHGTNTWHGLVKLDPKKYKTK